MVAEQSRQEEEPNLTPNGAPPFFNGPVRSLLLKLLRDPKILLRGEGIRTAGSGSARGGIWCTLCISSGSTELPVSGRLLFLGI